MTVIRPNSISGVTSITALANEINVFRHNGVLAGLQLNGVNHHTSAGVSTFHSLNILGNLDVAGVLTYQDVTNVDSIGIITARSGIDVTGNSEFSAVVDIGGDLAIADKIRHIGDSNTAIRFPSNDTVTIETAGSERLRINDYGKVLIATDTTSEAGANNDELIIGKTTDDANHGLTIVTPSNRYGTVAFSDGSGGTGRGLLEYNHSSDFFRIYVAGGERLRINSSGQLIMTNAATQTFADFSTTNNTTRGLISLAGKDGSGNAVTLKMGGFGDTGRGEIFTHSNHGLGFATNNAAAQMVLNTGGQLLIGTTTAPAYTNRRLTVYDSTNSGTCSLEIRGSSSGDSRLYFTSSTTSGQLGAYAGKVYYGHANNVMAFYTAGAERVSITAVGEVVMKPSTGGNTNTSIHFNNSASSPFISFKSNNLSEAAEIIVAEDLGGANIIFNNKNRNGAKHTHFEIKHSGALHTAENGTVKSYPIINGMYTQHDALEGQLNYHDITSPTGGIGGWVFLGHDYGAAPYPVRTFKIAVPENAQGTRVYQIWHNGDANYDYGGLYEIRINQWANSSRFESVSIRCINGKRDDLAVVAYNNTNGIMVRPSTIWGSMYIRKAGWDDNSRKRGSSYCAVENNGALAIYNSQGTDDGTPPTSGSPYDVFCFDASSHTGGRDIESSNNFAG